MGAKNVNLQTPVEVADGGRCCTANTRMVYRQEPAAVLLRRSGSPTD